MTVAWKLQIWNKPVHQWLDQPEHYLVIWSVMIWHVLINEQRLSSACPIDPPFVPGSITGLVTSICPSFNGDVFSDLCPPPLSLSCRMQSCQRQRTVQILVSRSQRSTTAWPSPLSTQTNGEPVSWSPLSLTVYMKSLSLLIMVEKAFIDFHPGFILLEVYAKEFR